jgi:PAS domain S-box-containing protein
MADNPEAPPAPPAPEAEAVALMSRLFLAVSGVACMVGTGLVYLLLPGHAQAHYAAFAFGGMAVVALFSTRLRGTALRVAVTLVFSSLVLLIGLNSLVQGWGLRTPSMPLLGLLVCMLSVTSGWRAGLMLCGLALAMVLMVATYAPTVPAGPGLPGVPLLLGVCLLALGTGMACGVLASQALQRLSAQAREREDRFRRLLSLAADAYWETDERYRVTTAAIGREAPRALSPGEGGGSIPWELPQFRCEDEVLDGLQADMDARLPFRDVPVFWTDEHRREYALLISGEPRFSSSGVFTGYWGVVRNVTAVHAAHHALEATETRYQELFSRIPTPLVLHRNGRVLDANPAAVSLFGHADLASMLGTDLLERYQGGDSRARAAERMQVLQRQGSGSALPVANFTLDVEGRQFFVRGTSVRVDTEGGPALLAIFIDDTERIAADEAVRHSEALLSHLVATSPDLITLTDLATGRYAMVNRSFEQHIGWAAAEAVGRTSLELGVWAGEADRQRFVQALQQDGQVVDAPVSFRTRAGRTMPMIVSAARFTIERREYIVINARDVSERERQRLEREAILTNASIGIAVTRNRVFTLTNRHFEQLYGWEPGEMIGRLGAEVWPGHETYERIGREIGPALARGEAVQVHCQARRKDNSSFLAFVRGRAIDPKNPADGGTVWIIEDVTAREEAQNALARARDEAEAASRAKSAFLANTSHELRTPLNGMIGLARLARDERSDGPRREQYLEQIVESAQSLAGIISDILDLSKIEAGKLQIEAGNFDLDGLLHTLQRTYATLADARGLALRLQLPPALPGAPLGRVTGDALRLRQVLSNFLGNALKFTASGQVVMRARRLAAQGEADTGLVRFEVEDTGPGIAPELQARLFEPFTQADQSITRRYGGTGLGLSICRELATLMGGRVGLHSLPGSGSTFWAELPLPVATSAESTAAPGDEPALPASLEGRRVLMVEDNAVNMMIAVALLEAWGAEVAQAGDGHEALAAVQQAQAAGQGFDAVLMDVQMPRMSGYEATRRLRDAGLDVPVIALTAAALVTEREEALAAGMSDFLTKPIDAERLRATLARWCGQRATAPAAPD